MMCAGGTDCAANVWILEMWPGKDAWLQALHFSFAVGCALGPLIVEPFLSVEYKENEIDKIAGKTSGTTTINDQNSETRIHIPYGLSGLASVVAALLIIYLYILEQRKKRQAAKLRAKQQAADGEHILLTATQHPAALEAGEALGANCEMLPTLAEEVEMPSPQQQPLSSGIGKLADGNPLTESAVFLPQPNPNQASAQLLQASGLIQATNQPASESSQTHLQQQQYNIQHYQQHHQQQSQPPQANSTSANQIKITSKARDQLVGRPPYYVMFAIALAAMCLSFYCGIEITSMNYLATFAVNIDLQLPKSTAALMSSALTISFAVGRGFGIWIAAYMKPHKLFYLCCAIMATGNVFMLIFANTAEMLLWYSICLFGIGCGPMFPAIVSFYDDRISKVTNTVSGIFILGSMFNVALNSLIIGHHIIDNALILIVCNLIGSVLLLLLFGSLHMLTKVKKNQRLKKFKLNQQRVAAVDSTQKQMQQEQQIALLQQEQQQQQQQQQQPQQDQSKPQTNQNLQEIKLKPEDHVNQQTKPDDRNDNNNDDDDTHQLQPLLSQGTSPSKTTTTASQDMVTVTIPAENQTPSAITGEPDDGRVESKSTTKPID